MLIVLKTDLVTSCSLAIALYSCAVRLRDLLMGFDYLRFDDVQDATSFIGSYPGANPLGGGTLLVRRVNEGDVSISALVRVSDDRLRRVQFDGHTVTIGAGVSMSRIVSNPDLQFLAPVATSIGGPAIRSAATVGGNLFAPHPYGDFGVALLALDARVVIATPAGMGVLTIGDFYQKRADLPRGTLVTEVSFEWSGSDSFGYRKVSRLKPHGAAIVSLAACYLLDDSACVRRLSVAIGALEDVPIRAKAFEQALIGKALKMEAFLSALPLVGDGIEALSDAQASGWYRQQVLPVHLRRMFFCDEEGDV